jgi:hypothetical protein
MAVEDKVRPAGLERLYGELTESPQEGDGLLDSAIPETKLGRISAEEILCGCDFS